METPETTERAYWVSLPHATFLLIARGPLVVRAAPIAHWHVGRHIEDALRYYRLKGGEIQEVA